MGFFGGWIYQAGTWTRLPRGEEPYADTAGGPWLGIDVHDSDVTTVRYEPPGPGTGVAYLGFTPRIYFEDPGASAPTDIETEAAGLAGWVVLALGAAEGDLAERIRPFLAEDVEPAWTESGASDDGGIDDAELFVEVKTVRFLEALGLAPPPDYWD